MADAQSVTAGQSGIESEPRHSLGRRLADALHYPQLSAAEKGIVYPAPATKGAEPEASTVDFIYDSVQQQLGAQQDQVTALEGKAVTVLGSASLLTASATALQAVVGSHTALFHGSFSTPIRIVQFAALLTYTLLVLACTFAYRVRAYTANPDPRTIRKYFYHDTVYIKRVLLGNMANSFARNQVIADRKAWWTKRALWLLIVEGVLLAAAALLQVIA